MFEQTISVDRMEQAVSLFGSFDENIRSNSTMPSASSAGTAT